MRLIYTVKTDRLQGEGSFVTFSPITWGEQCANERDSSEARGEAEQLIARRNRLIQTHLIDWNWTDAQGKRLLLPKLEDGSENPDFQAVIDGLTKPEMEFLIGAITSATPDRIKN